jgi:WD40 repeat protein/tRNA A-37 threonylcarbamoyl transferase component Bud32
VPESADIEATLCREEPAEEPAADQASFDATLAPRPKLPPAPLVPPAPPAPPKPTPADEATRMPAPKPAAPQAEIPKPAKKDRRAARRETAKQAAAAVHMPAASQTLGLQTNDLPTTASPANGAATNGEPTAEMPATAAPGIAGESTEVQVAPSDATIAPPSQTSTFPSSPGPGQQPSALAGYEILGILGRGGMGVVYRARQTRLNRDTALKMILSGAHAGPEELERFRAEAEAVARLQHPNIVQIYEIGERDGLPFFSLEFVDGGSLQAKLDGTPVTPRLAAQMVVSLARAMHYAHERGIVHRDIKPANILLTKAGVPKITDFGLAKKIEGDAGHTTTGAVLGTPAYMSPEQAAGRTHEIGPAADIYSLGAMLYEMLCGRPPFKGESVIHTLQLVQSADPLPPSRLQPRIPRDLETICLKCLRKEPHKRYANAEELAADLDRYLNNQPIKARRTPLVERVWKWAKRRPAVAALLALLAVVVTGGFFGMFGLWLNAEAERALADQERAKAEQERIEAEKQRNAALLAAAREREANAKAVKNYERARRILYATNTNLAQKALNDGHFDRARELLDGLKSPADGGEPLLGFEWHYLNRLCCIEGLALRGHASMVTAVVFSPRGTKLATASLDRKVQLWDVATGRHLFTLAGHLRPVRAVAFSADEKLIVTGSADGTAKLWDGETGKLLRTLEGHEDRVNTVAVSPDGATVATGSEDRTIILWNSATGARKQTLKGHRYGVTSLAFQPGGKLLASGGEDKLVLLWDLAAPAAPVAELEGHKHWVTCVAFDAAGKRIASAGLDQAVLVWDVAKREQVRAFRDADKPLRQVAFSPAGTQLAAATEDGTILLWDLTFQAEPRVLPGQTGVFRTITFSADGERLGTVSFDTRLWDTDPVYRGHSGAVAAVAFHPEGKLVASGSSVLDEKTGAVLGDVQVWDCAGCEAVRRYTGHSGPVRAVAFGPGGERVASGGEDCEVHLWPVTAGGEALILRGHTGWINGVAFQPGGDLLASVSEDGTVRLWDIKAGKPHGPALIDHGRPVRCVAFSPDGKFFATGAAGGAVIVWDAATFKPVRAAFQAHAYGVTALAFSPDGKRLATAGEDQVVRLWDTDGKTEPLTLHGHTDTVTGVAFTSDGKRLFTSSSDHTLKVWDTATGQETLTLRGHTGGVTCLAVSPAAPKDLRLVSGSWDQTVRVWNAAD